LKTSSSPLSVTTGRSQQTPSDFKKFWNKIKCFFTFLYFIIKQPQLQNGCYEISLPNSGIKTYLPVWSCSKVFPQISEICVY
jgi:hypothetical protein